MKSFDLSIENRDQTDDKGKIVTLCFLHLVNHGLCIFNFLTLIHDN